MKFPQFILSIFLSTVLNMTYGNPPKYTPLPEQISENLVETIFLPQLTELNSLLIYDPQKERRALFVNIIKQIAFGYILTILTNANMISWLYWKTIYFYIGVGLGARITHLVIPGMDCISFLFAITGGIFGGTVAIFIVNQFLIDAVMNGFPYLLAYYIYTSIPNKFNSSLQSPVNVDLD